MKIAKLNKRIRGCKKCRLWKGTINAVPGEGPTDAMVMLVGQNPGNEEDKAGRPFIGRSGKFLTETLEKYGIKREAVFITSIIKHKSPRNRPPRKDEVEEKWLPR